MCLFSLHKNSTINVKMPQKKAHLVILILSGRDYENLLKPQQKFLSPCLVFGSFKKVSECLTLCWNFTRFLSIFPLFFVFLFVSKDQIFVY